MLAVDNMKIDKVEALNITGGAGITASLISACNTIFKTLYNFGVEFGKSVRGLFTRC